MNTAYSDSTSLYISHDRPAKPASRRKLVVLATAVFMQIQFFSPLYAATPVNQVASETIKPVQKQKNRKPAKKRVANVKEHQKADKKQVTEIAAIDDAGKMNSGNTEKWLCKDSHALHISGDMKKDLILSVNWNGRVYKLPRIETTTGADRFYDPATGFDLVVIPEKAMLFNSNGNRTRLADNCKTEHMIAKNSVTPTQSNALLSNALSDKKY